MAVLDEPAELAVRLQDEVVAAAPRVEVEHDLVDGLGVLVHLDHDRDAGALLELVLERVHRLERRQRLADRADRSALVRCCGLLEGPGAGRSGDAEPEREHAGAARQPE